VEEIGATTRIVSQATAREAELAWAKKEITPFNPNWQTIVASPEWKAFLAQPSILGNDTVKNGHLAHQHYSNRYVPGLVALLDKFAHSTGTARGLSTLVTPAATAVNRAPNTKKVFKSSEYAILLQKHTKAKTVTKAEWERYKAEFVKARGEGRVVDDAGIF
jgi:hypothetical protein